MTRIRLLTTPASAAAMAFALSLALFSQTLSVPATAFASQNTVSMEHVA